MPKKTKHPMTEQIMTSQPMTENNSPLKFEVEVISVEAAEKMKVDRISEQVYGRVLTANQYNLVLDLMREYIYQNSYQPPVNNKERMKRIETSLYQPYL